MKAIRHILYIASSLLLASSCVEEIIPDIKEEKNTVTFTFSPEILGLERVPGTKAMKNTPDLRNIYYAVFDGTGYKLSEYAEAVPHTLATANGEECLYSVELAITREPRIVHIIGNAPKRLSYGSEAESIGSLTTKIDAADEGGDWQDSYWARLEFPNGIWEAPDEGKHGEKGSETYILQETRYQEDMRILNGTKLVRNFAKIIVDQSSDVTNFTLTGFWLTNYPDRGSVAPYNRNTGHFQSDYGTYTNVENIMTSGNYRGYTPASAQIISIANQVDPDALMVDASVSHKGETFCYEREVPKNNPLYVIVKGLFSGDDEETYYKLDIRNDAGEYFPILRNFSYSIHINNVSSSGHATLEEALNGAPRNGDISTSMEMQELTNISNGRAQLFVSETSQIIVGTAPVVLRYKYIPYLNIESLKTRIQNDNAENDYGYVTVTRSNGETGEVFATMTIPQGDSNNMTDGYREITLEPNTPDNIIKNETITITGQAPKRDANGVLVLDSEGNKIWETITRTVEYKLREKLHYTVECIPASIPQASGQDVTVRIGLEEGLPSSMFSLNLDLEAAGLSLTSDPSDPLPVSTGASTIGGSSKPAYHYTKLITWEDYQKKTAVNGVKYFDCNFKTNKSFTDGNGDRIYVNNKYFVQAYADFTTFADKHFTSAAFAAGLPRVGEQKAFNFTMSELPADRKVRIGLQGFEPWPDADDIAAAGALAMTHIGLNSDGLDEYEVTVSATTGKILLNPYKSGRGIVKLYANEFVAETVEATVLVAGGVFVWADEMHNDNNADDWITLTGYDVTRAQQPVIGQKTRLTVYVGDNHIADDVYINGVKATRKTSGTNRSINKEGQDCNAYYVDYTPAVGSKRTELIDVTVAGVKCVTIELPVWGITRSPDFLTSVSHRAYTSNQYYVLVNNAQTSYHLQSSDSNTNIAGSNNALDYYSLFGFATANDNSKVFVPSKNGFVAGTGNNAALTNNSTQNNGTTYTIRAYNTGYRFYNTRYWSQASATGNVTMTGTNSYRFRVYPVSIDKP